MNVEDTCISLGIAFIVQWWSLRNMWLQAHKTNDYDDADRLAKGFAKDNPGTPVRIVKVKRTEVSRIIEESTILMTFRRRHDVKLYFP